MRINFTPCRDRERPHKLVVTTRSTIQSLQDRPPQHTLSVTAKPTCIHTPCDHSATLFSSASLLGHFTSACARSCTRAQHAHKCTPSIHPKTPSQPVALEATWHHANATNFTVLSTWFCAPKAPPIRHHQTSIFTDQFCLKFETIFLSTNSPNYSAYSDAKTLPIRVEFFALKQDHLPHQIQRQKHPKIRLIVWQKYAGYSNRILPHLETDFAPYNNAPFSRPKQPQICTPSLV